MPYTYRLRVNSVSAADEAGNQTVVASDVDERWAALQLTTSELDGIKPGDELMLRWWSAGPGDKADFE